MDLYDYATRAIEMDITPQYHLFDASMEKLLARNHKILHHDLKNAIKRKDKLSALQAYWSLRTLLDPVLSMMRRTLLHDKVIFLERLSATSSLPDLCSAYTIIDRWLYDHDIDITIPLKEEMQ